MNAREALYSDFSINVGNPYQKRIDNEYQLNHFIALNSGINDNCYASTCFYQGNTPIFNEVFLETDTLNLDPIIAVAQWYKDNGIPFIPIYSGNRGFHIRALFEPEIVQPQTIKKFAKQIIEETKNEGNFDAHVIGDLRRLARIPNTIRLNGLWCIPLSQEFIFSNPPISHILKMAKSPQSINFKPQKKRRITEFVQDAKTDEYQLHTTINPSRKDNFFLRDILRPCIHEKLCVPNPKHLIRISATIEMLNQGLKENQIVDTFESLNWVDFNRNYTRYQIQSIEEKWKQGIAHPIGKKKLGCTKKMSCLQCILRGN